MLMMWSLLKVNIQTVIMTAENYLQLFIVTAILTAAMEYTFSYIFDAILVSVHSDNSLEFFG